MMKHGFKAFSILIAIMNSWNTYAFTISEKVKVVVHTNEKTVAGIGCHVDGKKLGGPGTFYVCKGPKNKMYQFGFRKYSVSGPDIKCGALTITKDSDVTLIMKDDVCHSVLREANAVRGFKNVSAMD
ncbi:MAG TPA: hypothetical protein VHD33_04160 [Legionellaceae bacterium]|nr:hypothetical protein [Legionellaceae bacterium]